MKFWHITLCNSDFAMCLFSISNESNFLLHNKHAILFKSIKLDSSIISEVDLSIKLFDLES